MYVCNVGVDDEHVEGFEYEAEHGNDGNDAEYAWDENLDDLNDYEFDDLQPRPFSPDVEGHEVHASITMLINQYNRTRVGRRTSTRRSGR